MSNIGKNWGKKILAYFNTLKLINIHIFNNQIATIDGNTNKFWSNINSYENVKSELTDILVEDNNIVTIEKFSNRKEAQEYLTKNYPHIKYIRYILIPEDETYYKTLAQIHPTEDKVLVVYKTVGGFIAKNKLSYSVFNRALDGKTIMSGYRWQQYNEWDYPVTTPIFDFIDPLNKGFNFTLRSTKRGQALSVVRTDAQGNIKEYESTVKAWQDLGKGTLTSLKRYIKENKPYHGYTFKYK